MSHWIIVPVILPAILGGLMVMALRHDLVLQRVFALACGGTLWAVASALLWAATTGAPEVYHLGNWPAPFGIVLMLDRLSALMVWITATLALILQLYAIGTGWDRKGRHFHALWQFQLMGICGAFLTADAFNLFVFFEVLLIASYGLMIHGGGAERVRAGVQYIAFNLVGSALFLFALATIYSVTGTLNMADLAVKMQTLPEGSSALMRVAAVLLFLVFAIKGALVPLQFWLPGTYANAPGVVAALFAVMTKVGAYAVLRFGTLVFPQSLAATGSMVADLLLPAALVTLILGALGVLGATSLPRLVAFAAIASMGTLFTSMAAFTPASSAATLYYLLHSTFATALMFVVADMIGARRAQARLSEVSPPLAQAGLIAALYFAGAVALAGMPPLSGFLGKLLVLQAQRGAANLVWPVILITSLILILGFVRAGSMIFWKAHEGGAKAGDHAPEALAFVSAFLLLAVLVSLTVLAGPVTVWAEATAAYLHDPAAYIAANQLYEAP